MSTKTAVENGARSKRSMSVTTKVYGIAAVCLAMLVAVAGVSIWQMSRIGYELEAVAERDVPLTEALTQVTIHQLEQAVNFERGLRAGEVMEKHPEFEAEFVEARHEFDELNSKVDHEIEAAHALVDTALEAIHDETERSLFTKVGEKLDVIAVEHKDYAKHASEAFELVATGRLEETLAMIPQIAAEEKHLDHALEALLFEVGGFTKKAALKAEHHEIEALNMITVLSVLALLAGGGIAFWVAQRGVARPLAEVIAGVKALTSGDLTVEVRARANDEFGVLARALGVFRKNAMQVEAMARDKEANDRAVQEERAVMMAELQSGFGAVVAAAVAGDFSQRVPASFADAEINTLASGVNQLLDTVDAGVAETGRVMARVAQGELTDRMTGRFDGAFADLQTNVNNTIGKLAELASEISATCADVRSGASEISEGAKSLSGRAEEQAASIEETAATMEEMTATVKANAETSVRVNKLTSDASACADTGGEVVKQAVDAVSQIEESANKIADIISVIDGIAFQTNLLALNAAVEAARAGDAGKGFAVVASEVRTLAQRSADAARDIRELIQSSAAQVANGVQLVKRTGVSLDEIVTAIKQVESAVDDIATASREQSSGVDEICTTIAQLDQLTQQNAAMASDSASGAIGLSSGAERMSELVAFFKTGAGETARFAKAS